jgi:hypothetical protein
MTDALSHDEAMDCICGAAGVTLLSYEEAISAYLRLRCIAPEDTCASTSVGGSELNTSHPPGDR